MSNHSVELVDSLSVNPDGQVNGEKRSLDVPVIDLGDATEKHLRISVAVSHVVQALVERQSALNNPPDKTARC
jgi:hypothetical protein